MKKWTQNAIIKTRKEKTLSRRKVYKIYKDSEQDKSNKVRGQKLNVLSLKDETRDKTANKENNYNKKPWQLEYLGKTL